MSDQTNEAFSLLSTDITSIAPMLLHAKLNKDQKRYDELVAKFQKHYSIAYIQKQEEKIGRLFKKPKPLYKRILGWAGVTLLSVLIIPFSLLKLIFVKCIEFALDAINAIEDSICDWRDCFYNWGVKK